MNILLLRESDLTLLERWIAMTVTLYVQDPDADSATVVGALAWQIRLDLTDTPEGLAAAARLGVEV